MISKTLSSFGPGLSVLFVSAALSHNTNSQVHTIDLSHNMIEDKGD